MLTVGGINNSRIAGNTGNFITYAIQCDLITSIV